MPVYNEKKTIDTIIERVLALPIEKELIIVDDGSIDGTRGILMKYEDRAGTKVIFHNGNKGKAEAIKTGIRNVTGEIVAIQDGDLEFDPNDLIKLAEPIRRGEATVVYGSRYLMGKQEKNIYATFRWGVRLLSITTNILYGQNITDEATCYKVFRADVLKKIPLQYSRFEFCPEVTARVSKMGHKIIEFPIGYSPRSFEEGKKIGWRDGVKALWVLFKLRFTE